MYIVQVPSGSGHTWAKAFIFETLLSKFDEIKAELQHTIVGLFNSV